MPAVHQHNTDTGADRPRYPEYEDQFGEDPARFLWSPSGDVPRLAIARIRGIVDPDLLDAYQDVEVEIGPRRSVIAALNEREDELEARGAGPIPTEEVRCE